jgi:hypothetical protein
MKFKLLCSLGLVLCMLSLLVVFSVFNFHETTGPQTFKAQPSRMISKPATGTFKPAPQVLKAPRQVPKPVPTASNRTENMSQNPPCAFLPELAFTFDPVIDGTMIVHDFKIQNKGAGLLFLESVKSG